MNYQHQRNEDILFRWRRKSRTVDNFSWNIFRIIKYYQINKENIIMNCFWRECTGKLNNNNSLFRFLKLFYFIEEHNLRHVVYFQETYLESLNITHLIKRTQPGLLLKKRKMPEFSYKEVQINLDKIHSLLRYFILPKCTCRDGAKSVQFKTWRLSFFT